MHKFLVQMNLAHGKFELRGVEVNEGHVASIRPAVYEVTDPASLVEPFLLVEPEGMQALADQLWEAGIRPAGAMREIAVATQHAGGQVAPWLMRQLEKLIDKTTKESPNASI